MRFALPPWEPSDPNCEHPLFPEPAIKRSEPSKTALDQAYENCHGLRKICKRDERVICLLIKQNVLNRKEVAELFEVSEKTISIIIYGAGLSFPRRKRYVNERVRPEPPLKLQEAA